MDYGGLAARVVARLRCLYKRLLFPFALTTATVCPSVGLISPEPLNLVLLEVFGVVEGADFVLHEPRMVDLDAEEAPDLVQAVDLLLLLDGLVLEPQFLRLGLGDSFRELRRLGLAVRLLRLHPFLPVLRLLYWNGRSVRDDPVGSVGLALKVEVGLGAHLGQGPFQHVAFAHVGERGVGRDKFTSLHAVDRRFLVLGSS